MCVCVCVCVCVLTLQLGSVFVVTCFSFCFVRSVAKCCDVFELSRICLCDNSRHSSVTFCCRKSAMISVSFDFRDKW